MTLENFIIRYKTIIFFVCVAIVHIIVLVSIKFTVRPESLQESSSYDILKLVDIEEYTPPPLPKTQPEKKEDTLIVETQPTASEEIYETEKEVIERLDAPLFIPETKEPEYVPQHKISQIPEIPTKEILAKIQYPPLALRQGIEAVVYLELYIDHEGTIRKIEILKDPGYGFVEAAIQALEGVVCKPAFSNGKAVAVRFRYPIRFSLK